VLHTSPERELHGINGRARQRLRFWSSKIALAVMACVTQAAVAQSADTQTAEVLPARVSQLAVDQRVRWLRHAAQTGALDRLNDGQLVSLFTSLDPQTVPRYVKQGPNGYPSYEFTMRRQERIKGEWTEKPEHMLVRMTREPLRIYMAWLLDSPRAGQEAIYDETKRADAMYGHLGGMLNIMPIWTSLDGSLARAVESFRARSRHRVHRGAVRR
jgi:hypothetical protein